jgi:hypothetical protein
VRRCEFVESLYSMAGVSSYGHVTRPGLKDPIDHGVLIMTMFAPTHQPSMDALTIDNNWMIIK